MGNRFSRTALLLGAMIVALSPSLARADETYYFMKMDCHPESKSVHLQVFGDSNESGRARLGRHEKDVYDLDYMTGKAPTVCDLGNEQTVSIEPYISRLSSGNPEVDINLNNRDNRKYGADGGWFEITKEWDMDIKSVGDEKFNLRYCSADREAFSPEDQKQYAQVFEENKRLCWVQEGVRPDYSSERSYIEEDKN